MAKPALAPFLELGDFQGQLALSRTAPIVEASPTKDVLPFPLRGPVSLN